MEKTNCSDGLCRLCAALIFANSGVFIFRDNHLISKIESYMQIKVIMTDFLPKNICTACSSKIEEFHEFADNARKLQHNFYAIYNTPDVYEIPAEADVDNVEKFITPVNKLFTKEEQSFNLQPDNDTCNTPEHFLHCLDNESLSIVQADELADNINQEQEMSKPEQKSQPDGAGHDLSHTSIIKPIDMKHLTTPTLANLFNEPPSPIELEDNYSDTYADYLLPPYSDMCEIEDININRNGIKFESNKHVSGSSVFETALLFDSSLGIPCDQSDYYSNIEYKMKNNISFDMMQEIDFMQTSAIQTENKGPAGNMFGSNQAEQVGPTINLLSSNQEEKRRHTPNLLSSNQVGSMEHNSINLHESNQIGHVPTFLSSNQKEELSHKSNMHSQAEHIKYSINFLSSNQLLEEMAHIADMTSSCDKENKEYSANLRSSTQAEEFQDTMNLSCSNQMKESKTGSTSHVAEIRRKPNSNQVEEQDEYRRKANVSENLPDTQDDFKMQDSNMMLIPYDENIQIFNQSVSATTTYDVIYLGDELYEDEITDENHDVTTHDSVLRNVLMNLQHDLGNSTNISHYPSETPNSNENQTLSSEVVNLSMLHVTPTKDSNLFESKQKQTAPRTPSIQCKSLDKIIKAAPTPAPSIQCKSLDKIIKDMKLANKHAKMNKELKQMNENRKVLSEPLNVNKEKSAKQINKQIETNQEATEWNREMKNKENSSTNTSNTDEISNDVIHEISSDVNHEISNDVNNEISNDVIHEISNEVVHTISNAVTHEINNTITHEISNHVTLEISNHVTPEISNEVTHKISNDVSQNKTSTEETIPNDDNTVPGRKDDNVPTINNIQERARDNVENVVVEINKTTENKKTETCEESSFVLSQHYRHIKCNKCSKVLKNKALFDTHYKSEHKAQPVYTCLCCAKIWKVYPTFKSHCYRKVNTNRYRCDYVKCNKKFNSKTILACHIKTVHLKVTKMRFVCEICGTMFKSVIEFRTHQPCKQEDCVVSVCQTCGKIFNSPEKMRQHVHRAHAIEVYICDICAKKFRNKQNLVQHIKTHENCRPYVCPHCNKSYVANSHLKRHMNKHLQASNEFPCRECPKGFKSEELRRLHEKTHVPFRPMQCEFCPKSFHTKTKLKEHNNIHTGSRPYKCQFCDNTFSNYSNWYKHMRRKHPGVPCTGRKEALCGSQDEDLPRPVPVPEENTHLPVYQLLPDPHSHTSTPSFVVTKCSDNVLFDSNSSHDVDLVLHTGSLFNTTEYLFQEL